MTPDASPTSRNGVPAGGDGARRLRFGLSCNRMPGSRDDWRASVERAEALGFSQILLGDHVGEPRFSSIPALAAASAYSDRLRFGTVVFNNDFRHPVMLAKDAATLDVVTDGRYQLGLGAGWMTSDYEQTGIHKDTGRVRIERLGESVQIIKGLLGDGPVSFEGEHYRISDLEGWPKPVQSPRPPILIGGGTRRLLSLAAREADIVSLQPVHRRGERVGGPELSERAVAERRDWVREAAGERFDGLELHLLVHSVAISDNARAAAEEVGAGFGLTGDEALASPYLLIGSADTVAEDIQGLRERFGISYFSIREPNAPELAPVLERLAAS